MHHDRVTATSAAQPRSLELQPPTMRPVRFTPPACAPYRSPSTQVHHRSNDADAVAASLQQKDYPKFLATLVSGLLSLAGLLLVYAGLLTLVAVQ